jgi:hypothetical protein
MSCRGSARGGQLLQGPRSPHPEGLNYVVPHLRDRKIKGEDADLKPDPGFESLFFQRGFCLCGEVQGCRRRAAGASVPRRTGEMSQTCRLAQGSGQVSCREAGIFRGSHSTYAKSGNPRRIGGSG